MGISFSSQPNPYDWKPELPDFRDNTFKYTKTSNKMPEIIDLRDRFKEYYHDFGNSSSTCIAMVLDAYGIRYTYHENNTEPSIRNCIKRFKVRDENNKEHHVEHLIEHSTDNTQSVANDKITYQKLCNFKNQIKQSLYERLPVIFGFTVYQSFEKAQSNGILSNPDKSDKILGGLCAVIVGYDNFKAHWIVKHPLGNSFGDKGYIYIPYEILSKNNNLTSDFWRILPNKIPNLPTEIGETEKVVKEKLD